MILCFAHLAGMITMYFWAIPLYLYLAYANIELALIYKHVNSQSMIPFYFSILTYAVFHILSREIHNLFGIQWFASIMAISLQVGSQQNVTFLFIIYITFTGIAILSL